MLPPPFYSSNVSRPRAPSHNKHLVVFFVFVFHDVLAAHAVHDELIAASRASASCDLSMKCCCTEKCSADLHIFGERAKFKFGKFFTWSHPATLSHLMMTPNYLILLIDTIIIHRNTYFSNSLYATYIATYIHFFTAFFGCRA